MAANSTNDRLLTAVKEKRSLELVNECLKYTSLGLGSGLDWVCLFAYLFNFFFFLNLENYSSNFYALVI